MTAREKEEKRGLLSRLLGTKKSSCCGGTGKSSCCSVQIVELSEETEVPEEAGHSQKAS
jgi:Na+-transporting NADH:ubiquinone oxidoreductase subunit NqrF